MKYLTLWELGTTNSVSGFLFESQKNAIKKFMLMHLYLLFGGNVNVADLLVHIFEVFCLAKQTALKMRLPKLKHY